MGVMWWCEGGPGDDTGMQFRFLEAVDKDGDTMGGRRGGGKTVAYFCLIYTYKVTFLVLFNPQR